MKKRIFKAFSTLMGALLIWLTIIAIMIWNYGSKDDATKSDCIIVLGAAVYGDQPSPVFEERVKHGITLHKNDEASILIFTGGYGKGASHAESEVGAKYATANGVSKSNILVEKNSRTTNQNLRQAKALMDKANLKSAILVSDPLHLKRASSMAHDLGIIAVSSPTPTTRYRSLKTKLNFLIREVYFYNHYLVTGH